MRIMHGFCLFFAAEMRRFSITEKQEAMDWIMSEETKTTEQHQDTDERVMPYKHILLATDFSPHARRAGQRARELADKYQARLSLVHVFDDFVLYDEFYEPVAEERFALQQTLQDAARQHLETLAGEIGIEDPADVHLLVGAPKATILAHAEEHDVDLIIAGSHGRRGLARLLGSVASGIVNSAPCDVLTVRL